MNLTKFILFFLIFLFCIVEATESYARTYTRSCKAYYEITPRSIQGDVLKTGEFKGKGQTNSYTGVNWARKEAYEGLRECIDTHWEFRTMDYAPLECTENHEVYDYLFNNLEKDLGRLVCRHYDVSEEIVVTVRSKIYGDWGCGGKIATINLIGPVGVPQYSKEEEKTHEGNYRINCAEYIPVIQQTAIQPPAIQTLPTDQPSTDQSDIIQPSFSRKPPEVDKPLVAQPSAAQPPVYRPGDEQPSAAQPPVYRPGDEQPSAAQPPTTEPPTSPQLTSVMCGGQTATIIGTDGPDTLRGTGGNDVIHGLSGNDTIYGGRGRDIICGGNGDDQIHGKRGNDKIYGEGGNDAISGGEGSDECDGGVGTDTARGCEVESNIP